MAPVAVGQTFEKHRSAPGADRGQGLLCCRVDGQNIHPVELVSGNMVGGGPAIDIRDRRVAADLRSDLVEVVLADEEDRQIPEGRHVQGLVEGPLVDGAVSEKTDHRFRESSAGDGIGQPDRHGEGLAHDPVAPHEPPLPIEEVHGAPHALADSGGLSEKLRHDPVRGDPPDQGVDVLPIGGDEIVSRLRRPDDPRGDGLFARVEMEKTPDPSPGIFHGGPLLEGAGEDHVFKQSPEEGSVHQA